MDVDGTDNSVVKNNTRSLPAGPDNRYQNAFTMTETLFHNEEEAERQMSLDDSRRWTIINPSVKNALGSPVHTPPAGRKRAAVFRRFVDSQTVRLYQCTVLGDALRSQPDARPHFA